MKDLPVFASTELTDESFKELLPHFFKEVMDDFELLSDAFLVNNLNEVWRLAHKINGSALSYEAIRMSSKVAELQECSKINDSIKLGEQMDQLKEVIDLSYEYAKQYFQIS